MLALVRRPALSRRRGGRRLPAAAPRGVRGGVASAPGSAENHGKIRGKTFFLLEKPWNTYENLGDFEELC